LLADSQKNKETDRGIQSTVQNKANLQYVGKPMYNTHQIFTVNTFNGMIILII